MNVNVCSTTQMAKACGNMVETIERLDYISAHYLEKDKVYQDVLRRLESSLVVIERCIGEMRSDEPTESIELMYRRLLSKNYESEHQRIFLAEQIIKIKGELRKTLSSIDAIPESYLEG